MQVSIKDCLGELQQELIHRLVAKAFISNPQKLPQVNHLDEDKSNNKASNLEWVSAKTNSNHGTRTRRVIEKLSKRVIAKDLEGNIIYTFESTNEAGRKGFSQPSVARACRGERRSYKGLLWEYVENNSLEGGENID